MADACENITFPCTTHVVSKKMYMRWRIDTHYFLLSQQTAKNNTLQWLILLTSISDGYAVHHCPAYLSLAYGLWCMWDCYLTLSNSNRSSWGGIATCYGDVTIMYDLRLISKFNYDFFQSLNCFHFYLNYCKYLWFIACEKVCVW